MSGVESHEVLKLSREIQLSFGKIIRLLSCYIWPAEQKLNSMVSLHFLLHNNVQIDTRNTVPGSKCVKIIVQRNSNDKTEILGLEDNVSDI